MYLQNKQKNDGGAPVSSSMLKLDLLSSREKSIYVAPRLGSDLIGGSEPESEML